MGDERRRRWKYLFGRKRRRWRKRWWRVQWRWRRTRHHIAHSVWSGYNIFRGVGLARRTSHTRVRHDSLVRGARARRVASRSVVTAIRIGRPARTRGAYVSVGVLVDVARRGRTRGICSRSVVAGVVRRSRWTRHALVSLHMLVFSAVRHVTSGVGTESIVSRVIGRSWSACDA